jgi:hypothetical protein
MTDPQDDKQAPDAGGTAVPGNEKTSGTDAAEQVAAPREDQIQNAVAFLSHPKVREILPWKVGVPISCTITETGGNVRQGDNEQ